MKKLAIILLVLLNISCDQISKKIVLKNVNDQDYIHVIENHFILTKVENTGAMLGFGQNLSPVFKIIFLQALPVMMLLILLFQILRKSDMDHLMILGFAFVIGGGIGNLMDRIAHGSVTDFFQIKIGYLKTGIFNMADVSVTLGVLLLLFLSLSPKKSFTQ